MPVAGTAPMNKNTEMPQEDSWSAAKRFLVLFAAATALLAGTAGTLAMRFAQARGLWRLLRSGDHMALAGMLLLAWIGFVLAGNGPIASAQDRSPWLLFTSCAADE